MRRIGLFGGTFDPVHYGHLILADEALERARLDELWLIPAAIPPHKQSATITSSKQRLEMLALAIGDHPRIRINSFELDRGGVSYTVETLRSFTTSHSDCEFFLLMGADSLVELPSWKSPAEICQRATLLVFRRRGFPAPDPAAVSEFLSPEARRRFEELQFETPIIEISSTELRTKVAAGESIRFRTPRAVERYIATNNLYATASKDI